MDADVERGPAARPRTRRRWWAAAALLLLFTGGCGAGWWWLTRPPGAFTTERALDRFRTTEAPTEAPTTTTTPATTISEAAELARPAPGVYRYRTDGGEQLDGPVDDSHDYPTETAITVRSVPCGASFEWRPLVTRAETVELCWNPEGVVEVATTSEHEFFRIRERREFTCDPPSLWLPTELDGPDTWTSTCTDGGTVAERAMALLGLVDLDIDGTAVPTVHVRAVDTLTGDSDGTSTTEWWLRRTDGLLVRAVYRTEVRNGSPIGDVTYREDVTLELLATTPET